MINIRFLFCLSSYSNLGSVAVIKKKSHKYKKGKKGKHLTYRLRSLLKEAEGETQARSLN